MQTKLALATVLLIVLAARSFAGDFAGWQGMRIIRQEGTPNRLITADLNGNGRDEVIVVNTQQSRLDIYHWVPPDQRGKPAMADPDRPNELPMAPDWAKDEIPLDDLPVDVIAQDLEGNHHPSLLVLASPANKILLYARDSSGAWKLGQSWDLLSSTISTNSLSRGGSAMLVRKLDSGQFEALVSCDEGVQTLILKPGSLPAWLTPHEAHGRYDWWLADVEGQGRTDLIEWYTEPKQTIRWYEARGDQFRPAQVLYDQTVQGMSVVNQTGKPAQILVLGGTQEGLLRRYTLSKGAESDLGRRQALPMPPMPAGFGAAAAWCGVMLGDETALVAVDPNEPRLRVVPLGPEGWQTEQSFPIISNVLQVAAPQAQPGTLLLWAKDAADLQVSHWEAGRLTYPRAMVQSPEVQERRILALQSTGKTTWWVQRVGDDLDLYVWDPGQKDPVRTRFAGIGAKADKVVWPGGTRLIFQQTYSTGAKLAVLKEGKVLVTEPGYLAKLRELSEFQLFDLGGALRLGRLTDGVLQWLGDDLEPVDQIMLSEGRHLSGFAPLPHGQAWVLEEGGMFIHRLAADKAGVLRVVQSIKLTGGTGLVDDPVLGLMLTDNDRLTRLSQGQPRELKLRDTIDSRVGRPSGIKEATIHRFFTVDAVTAGKPDVLLCDDRRHQLTLLDRTDGGMKSILSWPVFDDKAYPYGNRGENDEFLVSEPRAVVALDAEGDGHRDLAMLCHDRLIIYMALEGK